MRRILVILLAAMLLLSFAACGNADQNSGNIALTPSAQTSTADRPNKIETTPEAVPAEDADLGGDAEGAKTLIAYFSATNNTEGIANHLDTILNADLYEIQPEVAYTEEDLDYNSDCRANREQNDDSARPAISGSVEDMEQYNVVFLGYPIWWGQAPKIICTFLESYDFGGKTIVPFCTSGSSGIGSSATNLHELAHDAAWLDGQRFSAGTSESEVKAWVDGLQLP